MHYIWRGVLRMSVSNNFVHIRRFGIKRNGAELDKVWDFDEGWGVAGRTD